MFFKVFQIFGTQNFDIFCFSIFSLMNALVNIYIDWDNYSFYVPKTESVFAMYFKFHQSKSSIYFCRFTSLPFNGICTICYILFLFISIVNESSFEDWRSSMDKFFEGNFNETWNTTLNQFDALVGNISLYISCFEFNKFMAMPNEYEMEKLGIQLVDRKQLWAGIGIRKK